MTTQNTSTALSRRYFFSGLAGLSLLSLARAAYAVEATPRLAPPLGFSWEALTARARAMSAQPYVAEAAVPGADAIDFDAAGKLTYGPATPLTGMVRLLPVNRYAPVPVRLNIVEGGHARRLLSSKGFLPEAARQPRRGFA
jgi:glucans biosynthesis protein